MAISFIPVRDQANVIIGAKESVNNKGQVLKRIATGKKVADPRDDISDYRKISSMKEDIKTYNESIKVVSLGISKLETALSANQMLEEQYAVLVEKLEAIDAYKNLKGVDADLDGDIDSLFYASDINGTIDAINNIIATRFNDELVVKYFTAAAVTAAVDADAIAALKKHEINFAFNGYSAVSLSLQGVAETKKVVDIAGGGTGLSNKIGEINTETPSSASITDLITDANENKTKSQNNYKLILAGMTNLSNINSLAEVQKTNTEAAISALEDIDVQEEMVNLMQAQILEELSSEALVKIKESSRYIVNLIRA